MAYPSDHKNDTFRATSDSTSKENALILQEVVHLIVDAQATANGKEECKNLLSILENNGTITKDELYNCFIKEGVPKTSINDFNRNKEEFLAAWLLPPYGPNHQLYTHKGWDYDYSREDDKDYWSAQEIKQSWNVKKYLLIKTVKKIFTVSESNAKALSVLLYNIHRLRDIQYNNYDETTARKKKYLFNACDEIEKYVLPQITGKELQTQIHGLLNNIKGILSKLNGPINDDFWQELNEPINKLIGSIDNTENGLITEVVTALG